MPDRDTTKRMFIHMINMMEQHDTMTISCGDPLMELLKDVRELLKEQDELLKHEYWRGYNNGRADERGLQEGTIMQTFSPD